MQTYFVFPALQRQLEVLERPNYHLELQHEPILTNSFLSEYFLHLPHFCLLE
jgi:hypothetical protein